MNVFFCLFLGHEKFFVLMSKNLRRERFLCTGSDEITFQTKTAQRRKTAKCTSGAEDHIILRDDCNGDLGVFVAWWPIRSGLHVHGVFQFTLIFPKWFFSVSPCPRRCAAVHQVLVRHFATMHGKLFGKMVGQCTTVHHEVVMVQCSSRFGWSGLISGSEFW